MNKFGQVLVVTAIIIVVYLILLVVMPVLVDISLTANATMAGTSNMSNYPGAAGMLISSPWILFFVPTVIGIAAIVIILRGS